MTSEFSLYRVPFGTQLCYDLTIDIVMTLQRWPDEWGYIAAKLASIKHHEFLLRVNDKGSARFSFGDGSDHFNALKFELTEVMRLGQPFRLTAVRALHGDSVVLVDGQELVRQRFKPYHIACKTTAPVSLGGDGMADKRVDAHFHQFHIWSDAEGADSHRDPVALELLFSNSHSNNDDSGAA